MVENGRMKGAVAVEVASTDVYQKIAEVSRFMKDMANCGPEQRAFVEAFVDNISMAIAKPEYVQAVTEFRAQQISA